MKSAPASRETSRPPRALFEVIRRQEQRSRLYSNAEFCLAMPGDGLPACLWALKEALGPRFESGAEQAWQGPVTRAGDCKALSLMRSLSRMPHQVNLKA